MAITSSRHASVVSEPAGLSRVIADFVKQGWAVTELFGSQARLNRLAEEALCLWQQGRFQKSGIGREAMHQWDNAIRGDYTLWLDEQITPEACRFMARELESLRRALNAATYLGLFEFEGQLAVYPTGASYARHLDQLRDSTERCVSVALYLNADWRAQDGGELWLYPTNTVATPVAVLPKGGTLAVFMSADTPHEVRPAMRPRFSLSGWFRRRA